MMNSLSFTFSDRHYYYYYLESHCMITIELCTLQSGTNHKGIAIDDNVKQIGHDVIGRVWLHDKEMPCQFILDLSSSNNAY